MTSQIITRVRYYFSASPYQWFNNQHMCAFKPITYRCFLHPLHCTCTSVYLIKRHVIVIFVHCNVLKLLNMTWHTMAKVEEEWNSSAKYWKFNMCVCSINVWIGILKLCICRYDLTEIVNVNNVKKLWSSWCYGQKAYCHLWLCIPVKAIGVIEWAPVLVGDKKWCKKKWH